MPDWAIVSARLLQFAPALVLFGSPLFYLYGFERHAAGGLSRRWQWPNASLLVAAVFALAGAAWWIVAETAMIFSDPGAFDLNAVWTVLTGTGFGRAAFLRGALIAASILVLVAFSSGRAAWVAQAVLGGAVVASFAWTGHGIDDDGIAGLVHLGGDVVHLLTAAIWIGALLPLSILVLRSLRTESETDAQLACKALDRFSGIGPTVVAVLGLSGIINSWFLIGPEHLLQLFTATYGQILLVKLLLFLAMLGLATANRFRLCPRLRFSLEHGAAGTAALRSLKRSVLAETGLALLVLFAVSWMGTLEPPQAGG